MLRKPVGVKAAFERESFDVLLEAAELLRLSSWFAEAAVWIEEPILVFTTTLSLLSEKKFGLG